ncbi:MAG: alkaline phosphatase D family protein, partial [Planctomycetales bacterium]|nr:alkaline phosphatase D family protein [Planctomycetales bacterium]
LKALGVGAAVLGTRSAVAQDAPRTDDAADAGQRQSVETWRNTHDRVFLGGAFWANPMEDWRIVDGSAECVATGGGRNVQLLTHEITDVSQPFSMSVEIRQVEKSGVDGGAGFRLGVRADVDDYRAHVFANNGIYAGVVGNEVFVVRTRQALASIPDGTLKLVLDGRADGDRYSLTLRVYHVDDSETLVGEVTHRALPQYVLGHVAIVNTFGPVNRNPQGTRYAFSEWQVGGPAFAVQADRTFGPLLWTMYSLSDSRSDEGFVLKLSALTAPLGADDNHSVELQLERDGRWERVDTAELDRDAWVATFRLPRWDASRSGRYRVVYREKHPDGSQSPSVWGGTIRANPAGRPLRLGALTCQNDYAFPYAPVAENLRRLDPDMLYFSGDQLYENHGGYGIIRDPAERAILNYLRKFYQHGWAFRDVINDRPTLCIPDDHDVFQGNIWGEGGKKMAAGSDSSTGGYREPARMVNVVHKTNAAHHPDYYDPTPVEQNISVYYGDMVYGGVSFAILGDRQWKSGPERVDTGGPRADHVADPDFDTSTLDQPGLVLLGERQEEFLRHWADDWRGHSMKVLLSQTVFAGVATHHGGYDGYLKADLDSGGWPQTPRNRAINILRNSMALHINGDQHLTSLCQYGVDQQRDSNWSFCSPAIAVGYPRWWRPDELKIPHQNRPEHGLPNTGEFADGLGNKVYVYAVGNPEVASKRNRYERAHEKGSGFGLVTIDPESRTFTIESFRFLVDATDGNPENQFPGWPVTIHQAECRGENRIR